MVLSRRHAIALASSFVVASPLLACVQSRAQAAHGTVFEMADFTGPGIDADTAFAKALAAVAAAGGTAAVLNLEKNAAYRITRPLSFTHLDGFTLNGTGASIINTTRSALMQISTSKNITVRNLSIDYDPLPFTQGTIVDFDHAAIQVTVKVDPGYPDDPALLAMFTDGFFKVMDRRTRALKPGARDFLSPKSAARIAPGVIRVQLQWSANETFPSQLPIVRGDVVAVTNGYAQAVVITESTSTSFVDVKLFASPGMGILENDGPGGTTFRRVSIVPGPMPKGATMERLVSTNSDGSHFSTVERGPTIEDCTYANTSDDAVNVHGFYYYVVQKTGPSRYVLSPKWDQGLAASDTIETCQQGSLRSLGRTRIETFAKRKAPELKAQIAKLWAGRSPTTQPDLVYDVVLAQDLPLRVGDAVTSLTRIGAGAAVRRSSFHACGRVLVKAPNSVVEDCTFTYANGNALQAGSDIGFWSESGFAENLTLANNRFIHCVTGANELTAGNGALGVIYVGMAAPLDAAGFMNNFQNRNVTITGNQIDDSYVYAIFVSNADGVRIVGNTIGQTFLRGAFDAGQLYGIHPDSAIYVGRSQNVEISDNTAAPGRVTKIPIAVDATCNRVRVARNVLRG